MYLTQFTPFYVWLVKKELYPPMFSLCWLVNLSDLGLKAIEQVMSKADSTTKLEILSIIKLSLSLNACVHIFIYSKMFRWPRNMDALLLFYLVTHGDTWLAWIFYIFLQWTLSVYLTPVAKLSCVLIHLWFAHRLRDSCDYPGHHPFTSHYQVLMGPNMGEAWSIWSILFGKLT